MGEEEAREQEEEEEAMREQEEEENRQAQAEAEALEGGAVKEEGVEATEDEHKDSMEGEAVAPMENAVPQAEVSEIKVHETPTQDLAQSVDEENENELTTEMTEVTEFD